MKLIRGLHNIPDLTASVVTIGNFDGIHRGHQAVLEQLLQQAKQLSMPSVLITFEPQPSEYFAKDHAPARLTRLREKIITLKQYAIDYVLCIAFNEPFSSLTAEQFVQTVLVNRLHAKHIIVGDDFHFGYQRGGNYQMLADCSEHYGFKVEQMITIREKETRISSTMVRKALQQGDLQQVKQLLGRPYSISGRVVHGDKRGRTIGYHTANIQLHRQVVPITGVYAVRVQGIGEQEQLGVANIGYRPTVCGKKCLLEVHLFDFDQDIYGLALTVSFEKKIRSEQQFNSIDELINQIKQDAQQARDYFSS